MPRLTAVVLLLLLLASPAGGVPPDPPGTAPADGAPTGQLPGADPVGTWPLHPEPTVVRAFDAPASPWGPGHRGVDLLGRQGQPVRAALPGRVTYAGVLAGRGVVVVSHGATRTTYEPVDAAVTPGETVQTGGRLGSLQPGGSHCAPAVCLHWGWLEGETYLDPLRLVGLGPVRLLPYLSPGPDRSGDRATVTSPAPVPVWW